MVGMAYRGVDCGVRNASGRVADAECGRVFCEGGRGWTIWRPPFRFGHSMKDLILIFIGFVMGTAASSAAGRGAWSRRSAEPSGRQSSGALDGKASSTAEQKTGTAASVPPATRGKKLILKDGNFQLVRSYERRGEKVRYLSAERGDWEEGPAALVDWEATAKAEAADEKAESELVKNVLRQEVERQAQVPLDVDASLRVGSGVFLPTGEGMFAVQGKAVSAMEQVGAQTKTDKKRAIEQVI